MADSGMDWERIQAVFLVNIIMTPLDFVYAYKKMTLLFLLIYYLSKQFPN